MCRHVAITPRTSVGSDNRVVGSDSRVVGSGSTVAVVGHNLFSSGTNESGSAVRLADIQKKRGQSASKIETTKQVTFIIK